MFVLDFEKPFRIRQMQFEELDKTIIKSWESLEERALESNAFLSPHFVVPAIRHLEKPDDLRNIMFVFVEKVNQVGVELVGIGIFVRSTGERKFLLPHLKAYCSCHSYLSGILIDKNDAERTVRTFFQFFCNKKATWHGVEFDLRLADGTQAEVIAAVAKEFGSLWQEHKKTYRSLFVPSEGGNSYIQAQLTSDHIKDLRRRRRRLEEQGKIHWRALFGSEIDDRTVERFLEIEHMGWKRESGVSLRSQLSHEAFFREMVNGFRDSERLFFSQLYLNDKVIASLSNLISGRVGFSFKMGWDQDYKKMAPAKLNELEFIRNSQTSCRELSYIDSGAMEGSYIDQFWAERRVLISGIFGTTPLGRKMLWGIKQMRRLKQWKKSRRKQDKK